MRVLYQRHHSNGQSFPGSESESVGRRNQAGDVRRPVPVWRECANHTRYQAVCRGGESVKPLDTLKAMSPDALGALESAGISRRNFIKGSGALIITFSMGGLASPPGAAPGQAVPANFNRNNLALAGATAREALLERASTRFGVPVDQLTARDGVIGVTTDTSKKAGYGELAGGRAFGVALNRGARRKDPGEWTILGKPVPRVEIPAIATGQFEYVHNVRLPGMLHGQVVRPPAVGARVVGVDEGSVRGLPGVVKVVVKNTFVGVVAEKPWQAIQAAHKLKVDWTQGATLPDQRDFYDWLRNQKTARDTFAVNTKDVDAKLASAAKIVKATYHYPYQMHGSLGTSCAVAEVQGDKATVWSATQAVYPLKNTVAKVLGLRPENVRVRFRMGAGCYGINGADTVSYDAALLSQAVGKPVRVQLTRKDEMAWENFGVAYGSDQRVGLDAGV